MTVKDGVVAVGNVRFKQPQVADYAKHGVHLPLPGGALVPAGLAMIAVAVTGRSLQEDTMILAKRILDYEAEQS